MSQPPDDPHAPGGPDDGSTAPVIPINRQRKPKPAVLPVELTAEWRSALRRTERGALTRDPGNAALLLTHESDWHGCLRYDAFADRVRWHRSPPSVPGMSAPEPGQMMADHDVVYAQHWLACAHSISFSSQAVYDAMLRAARTQSYHPVRDYLDGLRWDGRPRAHRWMQDYLGVPGDEYAHHAGRWWLISAVARIYQPGCQADHLLVFEGGQGSGKSSAVRILAGEWYLSNLPDVTGKDASQALAGKWIAEIAELDAFRRAELTRIKEFLSRTVDSYRPPYGRSTIDQPRQTVFIGTTNDNHYLADPTGARRFWPVRTGTIDRAGLSAARDQLWAEAVVAYRAGDPWHPSSEHHAALNAAQDERYQTDEWEHRIAAWLNDAGLASPRDGVSISDVMVGPLDISPRDHDRGTQTRVGIALVRLGLECRRVSENGTRVRRYYRP